MNETLTTEMIFDVNTDGIEDANAIMDLTPQKIEKIVGSSNKAQEAYDELGKRAAYLESQIRKLNQEWTTSVLTGDTEIQKEIELELKPYVKALSNTQGAMQVLQGELPDSQPGGEGLQIKKLTQTLAPIGDQLGDMFGLNSNLMNAVSSVTSAIIGIGGPIAALTAILKLVGEYVKEQTEWDKMNARMSAFNGTPEQALNLANEIGQEYNKEFGAAYTEMVARYGNENAVQDLIRQAKVMESATGLSVIEQMKSYNMAHATGNLSNIYDNSYMSAWEKERAQMGQNQMFKYSNSSIGFVSSAQNRVISDLSGRMVGGMDAYKLNDMVRSIQSIDEATTIAKNNMASGMTLSKISGGNLQGNLIGNSFSNIGGGSKGPMPVNVMNSVMLSSETIDILEDLREHQFVMQVNLQHNTPMINQNNTFNNGASIDTNAILQQIVDAENANLDNGSSLYNNGDIM